MSSNANVPDRTAIANQVKRRMGWKLLGVLIVIFAYISLRAIESAKQGYEDELSRPIVLAGQNVAPRNDSITVPLSDVTKLVGGTGKGEIALSEKLRKLENQRFQNGKALIDHLEQEIRSEADFEKRALLSIQNVENRSWASKLPNLGSQEAQIHAALKPYFVSKLPSDASPQARETELHEWINKQWVDLPEAKRYASDEQIQDWQKRIARSENGSQKSLLTSEELVVWHEKIVDKSLYQQRLNSLKKQGKQIEDDAQAQINAIREKLEPQLGNVIEGSPGAPKLPKANELVGWFHPRSLLDSKSGSHVIYQTVQLTLVMVLVLGVIFVLFLLLRFLPFFANGADQIREQASGFFHRTGGSATPSIIKSTVVTASAFAIGAAVVVAGNRVASAPQPAGFGDYTEENVSRDPKGRSTKRNPNLKPQGRDGSSDDDSNVEDPTEETSTSPGAGVDKHVVELKEPILYPSSITVSGPSTLTLDPASLDKILGAIAKSNTPDPINLDRLDPLIRAITNEVIDKRISAITTDQTTRIDSIRNKLDPALVTLEILKKDLDATRKDLDAVKKAGEGVGNNEFERQTDSGGRGVLTRTRQFFNGDRYFVSRQALTALETLMSRPTNDCPATLGPDAKKCCGSVVTSKTYCTDSTAQIILSRLSSVIGEPPMSESDFMKKLRAPRIKGDAIDKAIDKWKSVILRYARVPY